MRRLSGLKRGCCHEAADALVECHSNMAQRLLIIRVKAERPWRGMHHDSHTALRAIHGRVDAVFKPLQPAGLHKVAMFGASGRCKGALPLERACALISLIAGRIGPAA
jgi:hypothetical protein